MSKVKRQLAPVAVPLDESLQSGDWVPGDDDLVISDASYRWTNRLFSLLERVLSVNLKLHNSHYMASGEIFLFNHFARFETFIPQYFIFRECGAFSRSIAASEFFSPDDTMSRYLLSVGAVPNNLPELLPFLALEILRGRKVIVFPEGGMVKDRRVIDDSGRYSVYSRSAGVRRKHHSGAAVLALSLDAFKRTVLTANRRGDTRRVKMMAEGAGLQVHSLLAACQRPTTIVPSNITFYPIRIGENLLSKGAELIDRGLSRRLSEELMIEGNILFKDTDMDIRLGQPVDVASYWRWWERPLIRRAVNRIHTMHDAFSFHPHSGPLVTRLLARSIRREVERVRDDYMHRMYTAVSVNLSHLASVIILTLVEMGLDRIQSQRLQRMLYRAVREVQTIAHVNLHRSLVYEDSYSDLPWRSVPRFEQFLELANTSGLLRVDGDDLVFQPKLKQEHDFDAIRLENLIEVYGNEVQPLPQIGKAVRRVVSTDMVVESAEIARLQVSDELSTYRRDFSAFRREQHAAINDVQSATESGEPFLLEAPNNHGVGVLLIHGFLASPAEMRPLAQWLHQRGHTVYAVRLKGHGTSPWDLRERRFEDWVESTRRGVSIVQGLCSRVVAVGFSTGGTLALDAAALAPDVVAGVCAICAPVRFQNPHMRIIPLVHQANRLVRMLSSLEGVKQFTENASENPHINYKHMPIRGLYELRRLVDATLPQLHNVKCPVRLIQASHDPVVVPDSVGTLVKALSNTQPEVLTVDSNRHGIAYAGVGETWAWVEQFVHGI